VGGRVAVRSSQIASPGDDRAVAHDHRAEREIGAPRLVQRHAHEPLVVGRCRVGRDRDADLGHRGRADEADEEGAAAFENGA
jgi:hypothetical protein